MIIRQASRADLDGVLASLQELNQNFVQCFKRKYVKKLLKKHCVAVAEENGKILGACVVRERNPQAFEIFAIGVAEKGKKVGSKLLSWAKTMAKFQNYRFIIADSWKFYGVRDFYAKNGFEWFVTSFGYTFFVRFK